jgi:hypothetical protein
MVLTALHAGAAAPLPVRFAVAGLAGLVATAVAAVAVVLQPEGELPVVLAAATAWRRPVEALDPLYGGSFGLAAGLAGGLLFELAVLGYERVRPVIVVVADVLELGDAVAALAVVLLAYLAVAVLLRHHGVADRTRARVRGGWLLSATVYGLALLAAVQAIYAVAPV